LPFKRERSAILTRHRERFSVPDAMKYHAPLLVCLALHCATVRGNEQIVTLGDSLTFAYEAEFCFSQPITGFGTVGDGFPLTVRNWIEILSDPAYRGSHFELGARDNLTVDPPLDPPFTKYFRQAHNWAIPGLKVDGMRRFLTGEANFRDLLDDDPGFSVIDLMFDYSDYTNADFALGINPRLSDAEHLRQRLTGGLLDLSYPLRPRASSA
jgi:hypothetical protein